MEGANIVGLGAAAGLGLALVGTRLLRQLLFGSPRADWMFYAAASAMVVAVGLPASWMPARRAAAVEPLAALREE